MLRARLQMTLVVLAAFAVPVLAAPQNLLAQGYQGLIADDDGGGASRAPAASEPQGYQGVIPGAVPARPAPAAKPVVRPAQKQPPAATTAQPKAKTPERGAPAPAARVATPSLPSTPDRSRITAIRGSQDLAALAAMSKLNVDENGIPADMAARFRLPATTTELLNQPRMRINGMLPLENSVKSGVEQTLAAVGDKSLPAAVRAQRAKTAVASLNTMKNGLKVKSNISDSAYKAMGMPPIYVKEEREAVSKSIARIDAALAQLPK